MLRNIFRTSLGALFAASLVSVSPATSLTATADELRVVPLSSTSASTTTATNPTDRTGRLVSFARGIRLPAGPGHRNGPLLLGTWTAYGVGRTFRFELQTHHGVPNNGNVPGMNTEDSRCTKYIDNRYKNASRATAAAAAYTVLNHQRETTWRHYKGWLLKHHKLGMKLRTKASHINQICKRHSPYTATMKTEKVFFGQAGTGRTTVLSATGLPAPVGLAVHTVGSNATILEAARQLASGGRAGFRFRVFNLDGGTAESQVTGPDSTRADLLVTPDGNTRLLYNPYKTTVTTSSKLRQRVLRRPTVKTTNPYGSTGTGIVRVTAKVPASADHPARFTAHNNGKNHRFYVKPGRKRTLKFKGPDASKVTESYCWVKHVNLACASKTHTYAVTPEVIAPAWFTYQDNSTCCTSAGRTIKLTLSVNPSTTRYERATVLVNGRVVQTLNLSKTAGSAPRPLAIKKGHVQVQFQAYRNSDYTGALVSSKTPIYPYDNTFN